MSNNQQMPPLSEMVQHLPTGKLEIITGVSSSGEVEHHPLSTLGHTLLVGGSNGKTNTVLTWIVALGAKNTPKQVQIAVIDLASNRSLSKTLTPAPRRHIAYLASSQDEIARTLSELQGVLVKRQQQQRREPGAWLIVIEGITELEPDLKAWAIVQALLREGKAVQMFVVATTRRFLMSGPLHDAFDTHMTFAPAPDDTSVDALSLRVAELNIPDAQPIVYLRIWFLSSMPGQCERCGASEGKFLLERYVVGEKSKDAETFTRQWYQAILQQMATGLQVLSRMAICEACTSTVIDEFVEREGTGHSMLAQSALFPKDLLGQISFVGLMQVGNPGVALACVCARTLEELFDEIQKGGIFHPDVCPHCGNALGEAPCGLCEQRKCWSCEGEMASALKICAACWNQYQTSVASNFQDMFTNPKEAAKKRWCDECQDWMPHPHQHKPRRIWRS